MNPSVPTDLQRKCASGGKPQELILHDATQARFTVLLNMTGKRYSAISKPVAYVLFFLKENLKR